MSIISDIMKSLSSDIQLTFEELIKLLLRKTLKPVLNPLGTNKIVYNNYKGKYERGLVKSGPDDNINKYSYSMTQDSLGWNDDILANFKIIAKYAKNNNTSKSSTCYKNCLSKSKSKPKSKVYFSHQESKDSGLLNRQFAVNQYNKVLSILNSRNMNGIIGNKRSNFSYTSDIPYTYSFRELESIGQDIIDQTDPSILGCDSAKMSTAMLRVRLYNLENNLSSLSIEYPNIFDSFIEMVRIINAIPKKKLPVVIKLIASLTYQKWENFSKLQQEYYIEALGENFINDLDSNELVTILVQSDSAELILTSAYLFPLIKMLFITFGYSKLTPIITDIGDSDVQRLQRQRLNKHLDKYRGASLVRQTNYLDPRCLQEQEDILTAEKGGLNDSESINDDLPEFVTTKPIPKPVDQCIYNFIRLFGDLYPTLVGLMGGTEKFPPETMEISCNDIPASYNGLSTVPEYLWRYNDYSYCRFLEYVCSKSVYNAINSKINEKTKYLQSI
ncbi:hypothetical protein QKC54_gp0527 [Megavirus baoshan]|uniref:Uncharacterized protein n=1 Tax=Megavirus baoshan TaxID=2496520 RepID=A0A3Q8U860_9VIRU|nr:hypothetical protein QKC54_gp0527 [Megavirus baoshan]AZL89303.1 hypothetical protein Mb0545 [Megavirus baoshan]